MKSFVGAVTFAAILMTTGCSGGKKEAKIYATGEKANVDRVTFNVVDMQTVPKLDIPGDPRIPKERFYIAQVSVFNGGNSDFNVPTLILVDDSGASFPELPDGRGVSQWLGVSRKLGPGETMVGNVLFDAPVKHYKLRISDEYAEQAVFVDMPVGFVHEQGDLTAPTAQPGSSLMKITPSQSVK